MPYLNSKSLQFCHNWSPYTLNRRLEDLDQLNDGGIEMQATTNVGDDEASETGRFTFQDNDEVDVAEEVNDGAISSENREQEDDNIEMEVKHGNGLFPRRRDVLAKSGEDTNNQNSTSDSNLSKGLQQPGAKVSNIAIKVADDFQGPNQGANQAPNIQHQKPRTPNLRRQDASESGEVKFQQVDTGLENNHLI